MEDIIFIVAVLSKKILKKDKPIYRRFSIVKMSKLLMSETFCDKLQKYHGYLNNSVKEKN